MNIGLLGFGGMGKTHSYAVENLKYFYSPLDFQAEITGVCCNRYENAVKACSTFGLGKAYRNYEEMLSDKSIDIIDICTPNIYHYDQLKKAISAGKHIYCEKPLCVNSAQAEEISRLADKKRLICAIVFNTRFMLPVIRIKELIDEGRIGDILSFNGRFFHSSAAEPMKNAGWKQDKTLCGGGVLFDLGSHTIDLIRYLCGEFESVSGLSQIAYPVRKGMNGEEWQTNAEEAFYMTARLENGACGTVSVGKIMPGTNDDHTFEIYGTKGAVRFNLMQPNYFEFYDMTNPQNERGFTVVECCGRYPAPSGVFPGVKAPVGWLRGHVGSMYNFLDCVNRNVVPSPSFSDGAAVQKIMEAAYASEKTGKRSEV